MTNIDSSNEAVLEQARYAPGRTFVPRSISNIRQAESDGVNDLEE
ncbi:hypothetical protein [Longimycelium tulufanense]|nr:hypothetical protein [Longimycelium tulufanense]